MHANGAISDFYLRSPDVSMQTHCRRASELSLDIKCTFVGILKCNFASRHTFASGPLPSDFVVGDLNQSSVHFLGAMNG